MLFGERPKFVCSTVPVAFTTSLWVFELKLFIISEFNSNSASSTTLIVISSVTLKPSINFVSIFNLIWLS